MYWNMINATILYALSRLTLTWDVLKFGSKCKLYAPKHGLTLTWDVLKSR